jgi:hypothetical protein
VSRDGGRKQKTDLHGLSLCRRHWLNYKDCMQMEKKKKLVASKSFKVLTKKELFLNRQQLHT